jgi:hypothetical protein
MYRSSTCDNCRLLTNAHAKKHVGKDVWRAGKDPLLGKKRGGGMSCSSLFTSVDFRSELRLKSQGSDACVDKENIYIPSITPTSP